MTRFLFMIVAIAAGIAFAASVPTMAVAGIHAVAVERAPSANADACFGEAKDVPSFVIVTCKKKSQSDKAIPCPRVHAMMPAALGSSAAPVPAVSDFHTDTRRADAGTKRLLRPPRG